MHTLRIILAAGLGLGSGALLATPAVADPIETVQVKIQAYELETPGGRAAVLRRIDRAARRLCFDPGYFNRHSNEQCADEVSGQMVGQLGSVELIAEWKKAQRSRRG